MKGSTPSAGSGKNPPGRPLLEGALDLTRPLEKAMRIPGDPPVTIEAGPTWEREGYRLSLISLASHSGTHLDAPRHLFPEGPGLEETPLEALAGPALIHRLPDPPALEAKDVARLGLRQGEALLLKTSLGEADRPAYTPSPGPLVTPGGARALVKAGIRLLGIDYPSIEPLEEPRLEAHKILLGAGVLLLEELDLRTAREGRGILLCFPLLFQGADGAPARVLYLPRPFFPRDHPSRLD